MIVRDKTSPEKIGIHIFLCILITTIWAGCISPVQPVVQNQQLLSVGNIGDKPGYFREPRDVKLTPKGTLLVTDFRNYRIQELTIHGQPLNSWGRRGTGPGQFQDPVSAAMDREGNVYAVDTWNHRIQKRDAATGEWNATWATRDFYAPRGITVDSSNRILIVNTSRHSVVVYRSDGQKLAEWGNGTADVTSFHDPIGIAVDKRNRIYVADCGNARIKVMDSQGNTLNTIPVEDWATDGFVEGYIAIGPEGRIYVTSNNTHKVIVYLADGTIYSRFGQYGAGSGKINYPTGIAVGEDGKIYLADTQNHRIVTYASPPALPDPASNRFLSEKITSLMRWILDCIALLIVINWCFRRFVKKESLVTEKKKQTIIESLKQHHQLSQWLFIGSIGLMVLSLISFHFWKLDLTGRIGVTASLLIMILPLATLPKQPFPRLSNKFIVSRRQQWVIVLLILFLGTFLRFYRLHEIPVGINNDAAWNGLYAHRILEGERYTPFTSEAWGKSTFYFYLIALSFKLFGASITTLYFPCIFAGVFTCLALFFLSKKLLNTETALIISFIYAVMSWNLVFSRTGYRAILSPLCVALTGYWFYSAVDANDWRRKLISYILCGASIGIGLHTYFPFRGIPIMMILIGIHTWFSTKRFMRKNWLGLLLLFLTSWVFFLPLLLYGLKDPHSFFGRSDFLFIGNKIRAAGSLKPIWTSLIRNLQIFHFSADVGNFFDPLYPMLSIPLVLFFSIGAAFVLMRLKTRYGFWIGMLFLFGLLPGFLSEADAARNIMTTLPVAILSGMGIILFIRQFDTVMEFSRRSRKPIITVIIFLFLILSGEFRMYFHNHARSYDAQFGYARVHTELGKKAVELSEKYQVYVVNSHFIDSPKFLCHELPGEPFAVTSGREVDFVSDDEIRDNLLELKAKATRERTIVFILDHCEKNLEIMKMIRSIFQIQSVESFASPVPDAPPDYYVMITQSDRG